MAALTTAQITEILKNTAEIPSIKEQIGKMEKCLNGNGKEGLCQVVQRRGYELDELKKDFDKDQGKKEKETEKKSDRNWALWMVVVVNLVSIFINLAQKGW